MECKIKEHMNNRRKKYPDILIQPNSSAWSSISEYYNNFCLSNSAKPLTISTHRIVFRGKEEKPLPLLFQYAGEHQGLFFF
jgi:hypothetical protein